MRTVECRYFKLRLTSYQSAAGVSGYPAFDVAEIPGDACGTSGGGGGGTGTGDSTAAGKAAFAGVGGGVTRVDIDATSSDKWVYLHLSQASQVIPSAPKSDPHGWDIAVKGRYIRVNGGASGIGQVAIHDMPRDDWSARATLPAGIEWHTDASTADDNLAFVTWPAREVGGQCALSVDGDYGWYYYSGFCDKGSGLHHVSPRDVVYLLRGQDGAVWKLRITDYYSDAGASKYPTLEYALISAAP